MMHVWIRCNKTTGASALLSSQFWSACHFTWIYFRFSGVFPFARNTPVDKLVTLSLGEYVCFCLLQKMNE